MYLQDSFYKELTQEQLKLAFSNKYDFDHPDALDMPIFASVGTLINFCRVSLYVINYSFSSVYRI